MELRKAQEMGGGTLLVSLPREWVKRNNIKKGSVLAVEATSGGNLLVYPATEDQRKPRELTLTYPTEYLGRLINLITGGYLLGFDVIRILVNERITYEDRETIKKAIRQLVGLEIVEEDASNITSQFLLEPTILDPEKIFRRMHMITQGMHRDAISALVEGDEHLMKVVAERDDEVDRLYFLLVRLVRSATLDARLSAKLNLSQIDCLDYRVSGYLLEAIGDASVEIVKSARDMNISKLGDDVRRELIGASDHLEKMQEAAVKAFLAKDVSPGRDLPPLYNDLNMHMGRLEEVASKSPPPLSGSLLYVYASMSKISRCCIDIADLAFPIYPLIK